MYSNRNSRFFSCFLFFSFTVTYDNISIKCGTGLTIHEKGNRKKNERIFYGFKHLDKVRYIQKKKKTMKRSSEPKWLKCHKISIRWRAEKKEEDEEIYHESNRILWTISRGKRNFQRSNFLKSIDLTPYAHNHEFKFNHAWRVHTLASVCDWRLDNIKINVQNKEEEETRWFSS